MMTTAKLEYDVKATAQEMRKALRAQFPGVKFSVRMSRGTGHGWLSVSWTDGPTEQAVQEVASYFQSSRFDGRDDSYHGIEPHLAFVDGHEMPVIVRYSCCGVTTAREYSEAHHDYAAEVLQAVIPDGFDQDGKPLTTPWPDAVTVPAPEATDGRLTIERHLWLSPAEMVDFIALRIAAR
jgi:hypothetical protein